MKVTKIAIRNYRGVEAREIDVPQGGFVAAGANGRGKTTILRAIRAALAAQDIGPDAIRQGADKAEILVDLDDISVRRVITPKSSTLTVEKGGFKASKPQTLLTELLGTSPLDPLDLFLAKPKERKALVLAALPVTVTLEQLRKFAPSLDPTFDVAGHGLEVIERARKFFYEERTLANKDAAEAKREAERLASEAQAAASAVPTGPVVPEVEARAELAAAERALVELEARQREAEASAARVAEQRASIATLREEAERLDAVSAPPGEERLAEHRVAVERLEAEIARLEASLAKARTDAATARDALRAVETAASAAASNSAAAAAKRTQATALESALAAATSKAPSTEEFTAAQVRVTTAGAAVERAMLQAKALDAVARANASKAAAAEVEKEAAELDAVVKRLANEAPSELLASAQGIPGLAIEGDEVLLDGKRLDALCGAEQLKLAVEIARRANARTKILVCDGLERLDPDQAEAFVHHATRDGYQLIATRVDRGDVHIEAIEPDEAIAAE
jgi:hypothetical protein